MNYTTLLIIPALAVVSYNMYQLGKMAGYERACGELDAMRNETYSILQKVKAVQGVDP